MTTVLGLFLVDFSFPLDLDLDLGWGMDGAGGGELDVEDMVKGIRGTRSGMITFFDDRGAGEAKITWSEGVCMYDRRTELQASP
jgi:hypothetical protein